MPAVVFVKILKRLKIVLQSGCLLLDYSEKYMSAIIQEEEKVKNLKTQSHKNTTQRINDREHQSSYGSHRPLMLGSWKNF